MSGRLNIKNYKRIKSFFKRNGLSASFYKVLERLERDEDEKEYTQKVLSEKLTCDEAVRQRKTAFENPYIISLIVPVYNPDEQVFVKMLESVASSTYTGWELCIADAGSGGKLYAAIQDFISRHALDAGSPSVKTDFRKKVKYRHIEENRGISANLNEALSMASGQYAAFIDHDDAITEDALYEVMCVLNNRSALVKKCGNRVVRFIYSDEDKVSYDDSFYFDHHKKTDFDRAMLLTNNYICHLTVVETALARSVGGFRSEYDGSQDFDFAFRCTEELRDDEIVHIPRVLYHWRSSKGSTAENPDAKLYAYEAGKKAVSDHLKRIGSEADVENTAHLGYFRVDFPEDQKSVKRMSLKEYQSMDRAGFESISEEYIYILSDELHESSPDNGKRLKGPMCLEKTGACCGKIVSGGKIESAGYVIGENGILKPACSGLNEHFSGYMHRASMMRSVDAYDRGCVMLKKSALAWQFDGPVLKDGYKCIYVPEAVFRRR